MEVQVKRKILAVLHDEINKILNASRELSNLNFCNNQPERYRY